MKNPGLLKYKIGLGAIGLLSLVLLIVVVVQASSVKQDNQTYKKASKIAEKLDSYVSGKGIVPTSLSAAGISDVPEEVTYTKISGTKYKFCVKYNSDSDGFDATYLETQLATGGHADDIYSSTEEDSYYLYVSETHHKGDNCQTVKSYTDDYYYDSEYPSEFDTQSL